MRGPAELRRGRTAAAAALLALAWGALAAQSAPQVLDRVVAVVNNHAILSSDVDNEMRLAALEPRSKEEGEPTPRNALQELISRALIQQQIREEDAQAVQPSHAEVMQRLDALRRLLPACVRLHCSTDAGWEAFLTQHGLTEAEVENYLRMRLAILTFIEQRFQQGIRIPPEDVEKYYRDTLTPQYRKGDTPPPLDKVAPRIEEILLQQQVNVLFGAWLDNLRKQGDVEILDPALEAAGAAGSEKEDSQ